MKLNKNKTIEQLENDYWAPPQHESHLVITCHSLRQKPLKDFNIEDLRIMIGQNIGLKYLIPIAIAKLSEDILSEGDFYPGDLLTNLLRVKENYWLQNKKDWKEVSDLFFKNREKLEKINITEEIKQNWFNLFEKFEKMH